MLAETAYAKINLALHVRGRRADGYHDIESLFAFAEEGDTLTAAVRKDGIVSLSIDGFFAKELETGPDNLVLRAAELHKRRYGVMFGADITLTKRSEENKSELQSLMRISYAVLCLTKKTQSQHNYLILHLL